MVRLTEEMIVARTRLSDMSSVTKLNCWGAELSDISVVRRLKNVEVLSLSVNNITSLSDIQYCGKLKELFIRKNKIHDLGEILWLRGLQSLTNLWLEENPCCATGSYSEQCYRHTVIKALPQLRKLDNVEITPGEMVEAVSIGLELTHPLDKESNGYSSYNGNSSKSSSKMSVERSYYEEESRGVNGYSDTRSSQRMRSSSIEQQQPQQQQQYSNSPSRRNSNHGYEESLSPQISRMSLKHSREIPQTLTTNIPGSASEAMGESLHVNQGGHQSLCVSRASSTSNLYTGKPPSATGILSSSSASSSVTNVSKQSGSYSEVLSHVYG